MEKAARRIIRSSDVKMDGQFRIDAGQDGAGSTNVTSAQAQIRIAENNPEFAIIEVTCGCGTKTQIRCEYPDVQSIEQEPDQKNNGENNNESE